MKKETFQVSEKRSERKNKVLPSGTREESSRYFAARLFGLCSTSSPSFDIVYFEFIKFLGDRLLYRQRRKFREL